MSGLGQAIGGPDFGQAFSASFRNVQESRAEANRLRFQQEESKKNDSLRARQNELLDAQIGLAQEELMPEAAEARRKQRQLALRKGEADVAGSEEELSLLTDPDVKESRRRTLIAGGDKARAEAASANVFAQNAAETTRLQQQLAKAQIDQNEAQTKAIGEQLEQSRKQAQLETMRLFQGFIIDDRQRKSELLTAAMNGQAGMVDMIGKIATSGIPPESIAQLQPVVNAFAGSVSRIEKMANSGQSPEKEIARIVRMESALDKMVSEGKPAEEIAAALEKLMGSEDSGKGLKTSGASGDPPLPPDPDTPAGSAAIDLATFAALPASGAGAALENSVKSRNISQQDAAMIKNLIAQNPEMDMEELAEEATRLTKVPYAIDPYGRTIVRAPTRQQFDAMLQEFGFDTEAVEQRASSNLGSNIRVRLTPEEAVTFANRNQDALREWMRNFYYVGEDRSQTQLLNQWHVVKFYTQNNRYAKMAERGRR